MQHSIAPHAENRAQDFRPVSIEETSNVPQVNGQPGTKPLTEIDRHCHTHAEFPGHCAATETFLNILMDG
jgi:hypothetical protein